METSKTRKMSVMFAVFAVSAFITVRFVPEGYFTSLLENDLIRSVKSKMEAYNKRLPEERVYLQTDKPFYLPGDDIWFSGWLRDGISLKPSRQSDIIHVELISPKGAVEKTINLIAKNGKVAGDFALDKEVPGGLYKLRAYTDWMKNEGGDNYFDKELQVQETVLPALKMKLDFERKSYGPGDKVSARLEVSTNENKVLAEAEIKFVASVNGVKLLEQSERTNHDGMCLISFDLPEKLKGSDGLLNVMIDYNGSTESISRSIPLASDKMNLTLFPEGGDLVTGIKSKVAFRALNEFGKPADVEGVVTDESGKKVAEFSSFHNGMGAFEFQPEKGKTYDARITRPAGIVQKYSLPEPFERGYMLSVDNSLPDELCVNVNTTESGELALIAQVRGKTYYSTVINALPGDNKVIFSTKEFPAGVCQVSLFDSKGIARAERLSFVNRDRRLNISIETDKDKYQPREKVKMTVTVRDERGLPMPANLSMAVVNDQLLSFADDQSGNILSQLLLQQDIREKVEEPSFYFDEKEPKSGKALDYLLMTAGWRRFTWEKLLDGELPQIKYNAKKALITGTVKDAHTHKPITGALLKDSRGIGIKTGDDGKFRMDGVDLSAPFSITFKVDGYYPQSMNIRDYEEGMNIFLWKSGQEYYGRYHRKSKHEEVPGMAANEGAMVMNAIAAEDGVIQLEAAPVLMPDVLRSGEKEKKSGIKLKNIKPLREAAIMEEEPEMNDFVVAKDIRAERFMAGSGAALEKSIAPEQKYYRARQFYCPVYKESEKIEQRTDFRHTVYWNPEIEIGYSGRKTLEFCNSDDISSFRVITEGIGSDGTAGRTEKNYFTQLPFELKTKIPVSVVNEDIFSIPVTLKNNTTGPLGGKLTVSAPAGLMEVGPCPSVQTIMPGKAKTVYLTYKTAAVEVEGEFTVSFSSCGLSDAVVQKIRMEPKGFPVQRSFSSQDSDREYTFEISHSVGGSLKASLTAFPNVVSDLMKGVEGILQEPYGCFEQTSCTAYPNAMVLNYLRSTDSRDVKALARATELLDRGYKRLITFETPAKGYEWFGANPAHEGLTAYGIMEFMDMKRAGQEIDQKMFERTVQWLLNHRDGKGGFERERRALHDFGRISDDVLNAYIVYALADAGITDIKREFDHSFEKTMSSGDPYLLALMSNAAWSLKEERRAGQIMGKLLSAQREDGGFRGTTHSITYSQGQSLEIETTALAAMAMLKSQNTDRNALNKAVKFLVSMRSGSGAFSSTQGTILALKALTEFAKASKRTEEDGEIHVYVDGKKVSEIFYKAGDKGQICITGLEKFIKNNGRHSIRVRYTGVKNPLPYSVSVTWNTTLPESQKDCAIELETKLASDNVRVGETVRLSAILTNKRAQGVPSTMAIIGIPAGFTAQAWQLKELQEKQAFDYYEIKGNNIAVYYRGMAPSEIRQINLDLKAEIPGTFDAPASSAYLYYTNEFKTWSAVNRVNIQK